MTGLPSVITLRIRTLTYLANTRTSHGEYLISKSTIRKSPGLSKTTTVWFIWKKSLWGLSNITGCSTTACISVSTTKQKARMLPTIAPCTTPVTTMQNHSAIQTALPTVAGDLHTKWDTAIRRALASNGRELPK